MSAFELQEHAEKMFLTEGSSNKSLSHESCSNEGSSISSVQTSEITNTDISSVIANQQKYLDKLTTMIQHISKATKKSSLPARDRGRARGLLCYACGKSDHFTRKCWNNKDMSSSNPHTRGRGFPCRHSGRSSQTHSDHSTNLTDQIKSFQTEKL